MTRLTSLHMVKDLMRDAMVLAHGQLFKLPFAVTFAIGAHADSLNASVVLLQPVGAA